MYYFLKVLNNSALISFLARNYVVYFPKQEREIERSFKNPLRAHSGVRAAGSVSAKIELRQRIVPKHR